MSLYQEALSIFLSMALDGTLQAVMNAANEFTLEDWQISGANIRRTWLIHCQT